MLLTEKETKALTTKILSMVKADDATASVGSNRRSHLRFARNDVLTSGTNEGKTASVTVWVGGRRGSASTNDLDDVSLKRMVDQAESIAKTAPVDREYVPTLGKQTYRPSNRFFRSTAQLSLTDRARQIGEILRMFEKNGVIGAGFHQANAQAGGSATKNGNFEFEDTTTVSLSVTARTTDGTSSGYFMRGHNDISKLDTLRIAQEAIRKALEGRNARTIEPGAYTVILEPQAVADLLGGLGNTFNARNAEEGRSVYSAPGGNTRMGQSVFDKSINIYSDPWHPDLPGSPSAQGGLPAEKIYLVKNGTLASLVYNRWWAKQKN